VPIWIANYILADYGTGAIMSVPAHDERDFEFAVKYNLPIEQVIHPEDKSLAIVLPFVSEEGMLINSGEFNGLSCTQAQERLQQIATAKGFGEAKITFRLKDWALAASATGERPSPWSTASAMASSLCPKITSRAVAREDRNHAAGRLTACAHA